MKVELKLYEGGGIDCLSEDCQFRRECANHCSAGDYRSEDGFTPELTKENGEYFCDTYDQSNYDELCYKYCESYPNNYANLGRGALDQTMLSHRSKIANIKPKNKTHLEWEDLVNQIKTALPLFQTYFKLSPDMRSSVECLFDVLEKTKDESDSFTTASTLVDFLIPKEDERVS